MVDWERSIYSREVGKIYLNLYNWRFISLSSSLSIDNFSAMELIWLLRSRNSNYIVFSFTISLIMLEERSHGDRNKMIPIGYGRYRVLNANRKIKASYCDGRIEVLGFTTATLAALQMGGRGERIAQCTTARMMTTKAIPMQVYFLF